MPGPAIVLNGQVNLLSQRQGIAAAGKYFTVTNPTPGTGIQAATVTAFSATANGLFLIQNNNPPGGANIQLDYLSLMMTGTAPTATTVMKFDVWNETGAVLGTTAVATRTPVQINTGSGYTQQTGAFVQSFAAGQITIPAAVGTRRLQAIGYLPTSLGITGDNYVVQFGADGTPVGGALTAVRATAAARLVTNVAPVIIAPGTTSWINMYWLTQATTAPTFEWELTYAEV